MQGEQLGLVVVAPRREPPCTMQGQAVQEILKEARSLAPPLGRGIFGNGAEHVLTRKAEEAAAVALRCPTWLLHSLAFTRCKISRAPYCVPTAVYSARGEPLQNRARARRPSLSKVSPRLVLMRL